MRQPWLQKPFTPDEQQWLWCYAVRRPNHQRCTTYFAHEAAWQLLAAVDQRASAVATRLGVPELDLMPLLPMDFVTWYDDHHHTPVGCRIVGEAVARALVDAAKGTAPAA